MPRTVYAPACVFILFSFARYAVVPGVRLRHIFLREGLWYLLFVCGSSEPVAYTVPAPIGRRRQNHRGGDGNPIPLNPSRCYCFCFDCTFSFDPGRFVCRRSRCTAPRCSFTMVSRLVGRRRFAPSFGPPEHGLSLSGIVVLPTRLLSLYSLRTSLLPSRGSASSLPAGRQLAVDEHLSVQGAVVPTLPSSCVRLLRLRLQLVTRLVITVQMATGSPPPLSVLRSQCFMCFSPL